MKFHGNREFFNLSRGKSKFSCFIVLKRKRQDPNGALFVKPHVADQVFTSKLIAVTNFNAALTGQSGIFWSAPMRSSATEALFHP